MASSKRLIVQNTVAVFIILCLITAVSIYLEFLGWRIQDPDFSLSQLIDKQFLSGVMRTLGGAVFFGILVVLMGLIPKRLRSWTFSRRVWIWSAGATVFLLALTALIMWAP
jgi:hypothetical protein